MDGRSVEEWRERHIKREREEAREWVECDENFFVKQSPSFRLNEIKFYTATTFVKINFTKKDWNTYDKEMF